MKSLSAVLVVVFVLSIAASAGARPIIDPADARTSKVVDVRPSSSGDDGAPTAIWVLAGFGAAAILALAGAGVARAAHHGHRPAVHP